MHIEDRLQICLLAVASRYPNAYIEINEYIGGLKDIERACWKTLDLIDLVQKVSPDILQAMAYLELNAQRCVIYLADHMQGAPAFIIYAHDKIPASVKVQQGQDATLAEHLQEQHGQLLRRILLPLDGSTLAEQAFPIALKIASATGGTIILMQAVSTSLLMNVRYATGATENARQSAYHYLDMLKQSAIFAHVAVEVAVFVGPPAEMIEAAATLYQCDLIVMSSHGQSSFKRWSLGRVAQKLAHIATTPVLVLHDGRAVRQLDQATGQPFRILVALDGSLLAESALPLATQLSAALSMPATGVLQLVRILHLPSTFEYGQDDSVSRALRKETPEAEAYLQSVKERVLTGALAHLHVQITTRVDYDLNVAEKLLQVAQSPGDHAHSCSIIALATHGRSGFKRWIVGSVTQAIVSTARSSILIINPLKSMDHVRANADPSFSSALPSL